MKLEVGMYVRTIKGKIWIINSQQAISGHRKDIINASHNIIDLIEVGDYVNGVIVDDIFPKCEYAEQCIQLKGSKDYLYDIHIKSIVTKEQFESMSYKIN